MPSRKRMLPGSEKQDRRFLEPPSSSGVTQRFWHLLGLWVWSSNGDAGDAVSSPALPNPLGIPLLPPCRVLPTHVSAAFLPPPGTLCPDTLGPAGVEALVSAQAVSAGSRLARADAVLRENERLRRESEKLRQELESCTEKASRIQKVSKQWQPRGHEWFHVPPPGGMLNQLL